MLCNGVLAWNMKPRRREKRLLVKKKLKNNTIFFFLQLEIQKEKKGEKKQIHVQLPLPDGLIIDSCSADEILFIMLDLFLCCCR